MASRHDFGIGRDHCDCLQQCGFFKYVSLPVVQNLAPSTTVNPITGGALVSSALQGLAGTAYGSHMGVKTVGNAPTSVNGVVTGFVFFAPAARGETPMPLPVSEAEHSRDGL